ncbi:MAG: crossover junction endodeoxyribonuclease RuvC [Spirochaetales bacterium]|nr:crossover junction endodeoxyribonuclease RuvC [Spirochaetales bacterium]
MRVLGIDPGLASVGWGIVDFKQNRLSHVARGTIKTSSRDSSGRRLKAIYSDIKEIIDEYSPDEAAFETLYFAKNITSALPVAQARGVQILACVDGGLPIGEYTPLEIKQAVVGTGRADKHQVEHMVSLLLGLREKEKSDHATDALAAAICHINRGGASCGIV